MTRTEETEILYQVCSLLLQAQEDEQAFTEITCRLCSGLGASCCSLWLARSGGGRSQERLAIYQAVKDLPSELVNLDFTVAKQAIEQGQSLVWQKLRVGENQEMLLIASPLLRQAQVVGAVCLWFAPDTHAGNVTLMLVHQIIRDLAQGIYNYTYHSGVNGRSLSKELEMAAHIQTGLLPEKIPDIKGISLAMRSLMAHEVGGDYLDLFQTPNKLLGIAVGDVMGKGIPAALWMAMTRVALRTAARTFSQPDAVLEEVNRGLYPDLAGQSIFVTLQYALYEPVKKILFLANAGHLPPLIYHGRTGQFELLKVKGIYIGGLENYKFKLAGVQLKESDIVLFYSDGVTEAVNAEGQQFGLRKVVDVLEKNALFSAAEIADKLIIHLGQHIGDTRQRDDISFLLFKVE